MSSSTSLGLVLLQLRGGGWPGGGGGRCYMCWGLDVVDGIRRRLGIAGELKWRCVKRRGGRRLVEALLRDFEVRYFAAHYVSQRDFESVSGGF